MTKERLRVLMGENIRNERTARNMSIDELAEMLELTSGFVGLIERGRRGATAYTLFKLSEIFNISIDNIFARTSDRQMRFAEEMEPRSADVRKTKIYGMINGLTNGELDFLINTIKGIKVMNHTSPNAEIDEEDDTSGETESMEAELDTDDDIEADDFEEEDDE
jgi:transcriptional regulator with XRE-family HTH domain